MTLLSSGRMGKLSLKRALPFIVFFAATLLAAFAPAEARIMGSAAVRPSGENSYELRNLTDRDPGAAWCTRAHRADGAWLGVQGNDGARTWPGFGLINGDARDDQAFSRTTRAKKIGIYADGKLVREVKVADTRRPQWFALDNVRASELKLVVEETRRGAHNDDLCIAELIFDPEVINAWERLDGIAQQGGNRALSPPEIKKLYGPLMKDLYFSEQYGGVLGPALTLYTASGSETELRMLLNIAYLSGQAKALPGGFSDGLLDRIANTYFKYHPRAVLNVWMDPAQVAREEIGSAYSTFVSPLGGGALEQYKRTHEDFRALANEIEKNPRGI